MKMALYPEIQIERIKSPNRFYAIPIIGFVVKFIMIIPVSLELAVLRWAQIPFSMLNSFNIFFHGRYWKLAYELNIGIMRLETNASYFIYGLTDRYPGFSLKTTEEYTFTLPFNKNPNHVLATPLLGVLLRLILMIPYIIYRHIVTTAAFLAILVSWIPVLLTRRYPETTYEIARDSVRVDQATSAYFLGMSDDYPSFWISMNHKSLKVLLFVLATLFMLWSFWNNINTGFHPSQRNMKQQEYRYQNTVHNLKTNSNTY